MKNKTTTYKWAYLPFVFSSAAIIATQVTAAPTGQSYQDAKQVNSINHEYVGSGNAIGFGISDEGDLDVTFDGTISSSENHRTGVGLWAGYDVDESGVQGRGGQINHAWTSKDASGRVRHVNKAFVAYDRNDAGNDRATVGYGQEKENFFWDGRVSTALSGGTNERTINGNVVTDRGYEWGVGATVGKFLPQANARIRAGIDHEWSDEVGAGESDARNTTLSAGIEKFFHGTGHSVSLDVAGSRTSGGFDDDSDTDFTGRLGYRYDFGGASIYQPDRRYKRVRVEVPGQAVAPQYAKQQQFKKVPTYKTVPVYGNKQVRTPTRQLVKSTMELEGQTFFKYGSSKLIPSAKTRLKQIAAQINKTGYKGQIRITGNTCGLSNARYDKILSEKRAKAVKNFLVAHGFNPNHMVTRGLGKNHPKYAKTPDQDFKNRRVDIEYVTEQQVVKTGFNTTNKRVQTGTRQVATGFKNVPAGFKNVLVSSGQPGTPRVIWKTQAIPTSPAWIKRALNNNIRHNTNINTFTTTFGNDAPVVVEVAPVAVDDNASTTQGTPVTIDVLGNDTSNSGSGDLTISSVGNAANGTTAIVGGQIVYTPNPDFVGKDTFTYTITDSNGLTTTATASVVVEAAVVAPEAQNDSATTASDTPVTIDVLANDTSNSGSGELTITEVTNVVGGTAAIVNNMIVFTPTPGFAGKATFTYTVTDSNGETATATGSVVVDAAPDEAPEAVNDSATTPFDTAVTLDVLANDTSNSGSGELTITEVTNVVGGTAAIVGNEIVFTPTPGFEGKATFTYTITDSNGLTTTATGSVVVGNAPEVAPEATNDTATTAFDTPVSVDVLANDESNSGSGELTISSVTNVVGGTAAIVNGEILFTPTPGFEGKATFTYTITDSNGLTTTATGSVLVGNAPEVAPEATNDSATTPFETPVSIDVLDNDTSNSGSGELTITSVTNVVGGTAAIVNGEIVFTPAAGFEGKGSFTYTITDSNGLTTTATGSVLVGNAPDVAPDAVNDRVTTQQDTPITIDVLDNDTSNSGSGELTITAISNIVNGTAEIVNGQIVFTPTPGFSGEGRVRYTITDSNGLTRQATAVITIEKAPDVAPDAANDSVSTQEGTPVTIDVLDNDTSNSGSNQLTITSVENGANGTTAISGGQIVYTPNAGFSGKDQFTYTITDSNGLTTTATVSVDIEAAPAKPPVAQNDFAEITEGTAFVMFDVLTNDTSNSGSGELTVTRVLNSNNGSAEIVNGQVKFTPNAGFVGRATTQYEITDSNGLTTRATLVVVVVADRDPNKVVADAIFDDVLVKAGREVTIDVLANDLGDGLRITGLSSPKVGSARIVGNQIVFKLDDRTFNGTIELQYDIIDEHGNRDWSPLIIDVMADH